MGDHANFGAGRHGRAPGGSSRANFGYHSQLGVEMITRYTAFIATIAALLLLAAPAAAQKPSLKKSIWGPAQVNGVSQFPIYRDLGAGIWQTVLEWNTVAPTRPRRATDPNDPAYRWPADVDFAVREARRHGIRVSLTVMWAPRWANGGRSRAWAPEPRHYARFMRAAARRYPGVRLWLIWGEPSRRENFRPLPSFEATGPRQYARLLDAAYRALKRQNRRNLVIGGNTFTTGHVTPRAFIRGMRLRGGRRPRMDMYGHNPFTARSPALHKDPLGFGYADFSDLDTLARWIDRSLGRAPGGRRLPLFLSEFTLPTDHQNHEFNFWVDRETQADWLRRALRITRRWGRIYTLGWYDLYDEPPRAAGDEVNHGLLDWQGRKKPAYRVFKRG
jgi:hypothetical protein